MLIFNQMLYAQTAGLSKSKGDSLFVLGDYAAASEYYSKEISVNNKNVTEQYLYNKLQYALCEIRLNNLEKAQGIIDEGLAECGEQFKNEDALFMNAQAQIFYQKGQLEQAASEVENAIDLLTMWQFYSKTVLAELYNTEGIINWMQGNDEKALEYFNQSLELYKTEYDADASAIAGVYNNIGLVYSGFDLQLSLTYYERALKMYEHIYSADHPALAIAYSNLGQIYRKQKVYNTSLVQYEKALDIWNKRYAGPHPNKAFVYSSIAQVLQEKKEYPSALDYAGKALAIYQQAYGEKHPNTAACYTLIGSVYSDQREYTKALEALQHSLIANSATFSSADYTKNPSMQEYFDGQLLLSTLTHKGIVLSKREAEQTLRIKDLTLALSTYQSCDTLLSQLRQTRTGKNDKLALGIYSNDVYDRSMELCLLLSENTFKKERYLKLAYYFVERSKASVLQESIADSKAKEFAGIPNKEIEKEDAYKTTIAYLEQRIAKGITDEATMKSVAAELFGQKREYEFFIRSLEKNYPAYYNLKYDIQSITVETLQSKLNPTDCILEYFVSESTNTVRIFRITQKTYDVYSIPLTDWYGKNISAMRNSIKFNNKALFIKASSALYEQLMPKISKHTTHLIIIPDGKMSAIPFEALLVKAPENDTVNYTQMEFLIKRYAVSYNYAGSLYDQSSSDTILQKKVLLFAPVEFSDSSYLNPLPGTLKEVECLNTICKSYAAADMYIYTKATREVLLSDSISQYSIIHLATHGVVDAEQPELSCIYTSGTSEEDSRIYSGDMYNMRLHADLVALSACETGLGKYAKGEGMIGLSRALFYAGADNIMVSLWTVSDQSAQLFMQYFYTDFQPDRMQTLAFASREAKLKLLQSAEYNTPYHWAAFILIGK